MQVESAVRCSACSRPLAMAPGTGVIKGGQLHMQLLEMTHISSGAVQVWGPKPTLLETANKTNASTSANTPTGAVAAAASHHNAFSADPSAATVAGSVAPTAEGAAAKLALIESGNVSGTVIFSNKLAFHRLCYMRMHC